jgi:hypothetical protein
VQAVPLVAVRPTPHSSRRVPIEGVQGGEMGGRVLGENLERALR